ncbi:MAG TPA: zinc-ribbon domain-containing protein [Pyrinomonadaceae bacterium]|nr:zinc-ribbon domain-containing protein [Pyrinomonadaceae bacterium]
MFCPKCGAVQSDEMKFCKTCGANLQAVRQLVDAGGAGEKFDWSKTWVADMLLSEAERKKRDQELERSRGVTPEMKRFNEIKGGVITACVGIGITIFLYIFMQGIVLSGQNPPHDNEILSRIWVAGVIPFCVGLALLINGIFVSKKQVDLARREQQAGQDALPEVTQRQALRAGSTAEIIPPGFSVTEGTTKHLKVAAQKMRDPDNT